MRGLSTIFITTIILLLPSVFSAQVGIGTTTPDSSAVLDLVSIDRGFLLPRLTTTQRQTILNPAKGLMIYNLTTNRVQVNTGTPASPIWLESESSPDSSIITNTVSEEVSTTSTTYVIVPGMSLTPPAGTYLVLFNGQYGLVESEPVSTAQGVIDLNAAYTALMALVPTSTTHGAIFGNGETLSPGVYDLPAAASLAGTLTLDGGGDANSLFVIRTGGALTSGAMTTVVLTNGASANNIFWISEGALALAANTIMKGTLIAHNAAASAAAGADLEGRLFSTTGALSVGPGTIYVPSGSSPVDLGVLSTFIMFTSSGAISNTDPSTLTGDVGTNSGAIAGFENLNGNIYGPGAPPPPEINTLVTFSVFQNGVLVPASDRTNGTNTSLMALQGVATVTEGQQIDIRWLVDNGGIMIGNRIISLHRID